MVVTIEASLGQSVQLGQGGGGGKKEEKKNSSKKYLIIFEGVFPDRVSLAVLEFAL